MIVSDITAQIELLQQLHHHAVTDSLTEISNRRAFDATLWVCGTNALCWFQLSPTTTPVVGVRCQQSHVFGRFGFKLLKAPFHVTSFDMLRQ
jgi:hypothetical protein